jgi:hypothetical protein
MFSQKSYAADPFFASGTREMRLRNAASATTALPILFAFAYYVRSFSGSSHFAILARILEFVVIEALVVFRHAWRQASTVILICDGSTPNVIASRSFASLIVSGCNPD